MPPTSPLLLGQIFAVPGPVPCLLAALDGPSVSLWCWLGFGVLMVVLIATDLLALHGRQRDPSVVESAVTAAVWCLLAMAFNGVIWWWRGGTAGIQFCTGYLLEWSLSVDNVFVFAVIFRYFQVPKVHQYRILYWGILGAIAMRLAFILAGSALIARFQFILPLFGLFLIYTAYHLARHSSNRVDPQRNLVFRFARRWLPLAEELEPEAAKGAPSAMNYGGSFLVRQAGRLRVTPPLLVLLVVESTDLLFAVDSVPAIFGITRVPFIIFTSNVFAILGLRALYFLLADFMDMFRYLHYGLAAVLAFVGLKMIGENWLVHAPGTELVPTWASLAVMAVLLGAAVAASILAAKKDSRAQGM
jgi:tellurite resistance protein TerC